MGVYTMSIDKDYELIVNSGLFDSEYYFEKYNLDKNVNPIYHYLEFGVNQNFNPSKNFDTKYYLTENPDVKNSKINPFVHYIKWGKDEDRPHILKNIDEVKNDWKNLKMSLFGKNNYFFLINDSNSEILQHYDPSFKIFFDYNCFNDYYKFKKYTFNKNNIDYHYFVIPDKSIVCKKYLPFKYEKINRIIDTIDEIEDLSKNLKETDYYPHDTHLNYIGGKKLTYQIIKNINSEINEEIFEEMLLNNILVKEEHYFDLLFEFNFSGTNEKRRKYDAHSPVFYEKPIYLEELEIPEEFNYCLKRKSYHYYNKNSYSNKRVLIFHDSTIESLKPYLSFYFREMFLFWDHGSLNEQLIKYYNPDIVLEIRVERFIKDIKHPEWVMKKNEIIDEKLVTPKKIIETKKDNAPTPKMSIIIPVYNVEKYLKQCLDSVVNQNFDNYEIICVNDGSTDNSLDILKEYHKKYDNFKIINSTNKGLGAARNLGITKASGDYVFFIDSDDWIEDNALSILYEKIEEQNLDMLFFQIKNYEDNSGRFYTDKIYDLDCLIDLNLDNKIFTHEKTKNVLFEIPVVAYSKIYKRSLIEKNNIIFKENYYFEDHDFFYNFYFKAKKVGFLKQYILNRRRRVDSITGSFNEKQMDIIKVSDDIIEIFKENKLYDLYKKELINHKFEDVMYWFNKTPLEFKEIFFNKIKYSFKAFDEYKNDYISLLNEENIIKYRTFIESEHYIHFNSLYKLKTSKYEIFNGKHDFSKNSKDYEEYHLIENKRNYKLSIVIPIYNNGSLTHRTMMSLENQTLKYEDVEILLINDNSSDDTAEIINRYAILNPNVKAIHLNKSSGSSGNPRNIGIKESHADYIMFLDHDDFLELNAIEILYNEINNSNVDVVFGTYSTIENNVVQKALTPNEKRGYFEDIDENPRLIGIPAPSIWTKIFDKNFLLKHHILFPTILGEDAIFMLETLVNANGIKYLWDTNICYHDLRDSSTTNNITYEYMQELLTSEIHMYNYLKKYDKKDYYKNRSINIIDFTFDQLTKSSLTNNEIDSLFGLLREFVLIHDNFEEKPRKNEFNKIIFNLIKSNDKESLISYIRKYLKDKEHINNLKENQTNLKHETNVLNKNFYNALNVLNSLRRQPVLNSFTNNNQIVYYNNQKIYDNNLISIIIPVYNKEKYVEKCIKSILTQSYNFIEIICVNDCSTDNSLKIITDLSKKYSSIKILENKKNIGSGASRNKGLKNALGRYIMFMDADDYYSNNQIIEKLVKYIKKFNAPMISANLDYLRNHKIIHEDKYLNHIKEIQIKKSSEYGIPWYYTRNIYDKAIIDLNNIYFPESTFGEDPIFLTKYLLNIDYYIEIPDDCYRYRASNEIRRNTFEKYYEDLLNNYNVLKLVHGTDYKIIEKEILRVVISRLHIDNYVNNIYDLQKLIKLYDAFMEILEKDNLGKDYDNFKLSYEQLIDNKLKEMIKSY